MYDIHIILSNTPGSLGAMGIALGNNGVGLTRGQRVFCSMKKSMLCLRAGQPDAAHFAASWPPHSQMYDIHIILSNTPGSLGAMGIALGNNGVGLEVRGRHTSLTVKPASVSTLRAVSPSSTRKCACPASFRDYSSDRGAQPDV
jgi:hypothetical protein